MKKIAIVLNGIELNSEITEPFVICADGGLRLLKNRTPNLLIGDMDSVGVVPAKIVIEKYSPVKDYSDGALAVIKAKELGADYIVIYAANGGRYDHVTANLGLLELAAGMGMDGEIIDGKTRVQFKNKSFTASVKVGQTISLISMNGCVVQSAYGLFYPLNNLKLNFCNSSLGISNKATAENIHINISDGSLFIFYID